MGARRRYNSDCDELCTLFAYLRAAVTKNGTRSTLQSKVVCQHAHALLLYVSLVSFVSTCVRHCSREHVSSVAFEASPPQALALRIAALGRQHVLVKDKEVGN